MKLSEQIDDLEKRLEKALSANDNYRNLNFKLVKRIQELEVLVKMMIPNQVYTHKERKNTTVKFLDGSQQTVTRKSGEKDCLETAIAYCLLKQALPTKDLRKLIENREEH